MALKKITYGDLGQLLESEGFRRKAMEAPHELVLLSGSDAAVGGAAFELFEKPGTRAALVLPVRPSSTQAADMHVAMVRKTLVDFGVMTSADFRRWVADPKHYQAA